MATPNSQYPEVYGLTGGMGSGKSTVARRFNANGAYIVDADAVVHDLIEPEQPMLEVMVSVLGDEVVVDGTLDRARVSELIFNDTALNNRLRRAMNSGIMTEVEHRILHARSDDTVVFDAPLLDPHQQIGGRSLRGVIVVDTPDELAIARLRVGRGIDESEARRRLAHQLSREERLSFADYVIVNDGDLEDLNSQVDEVWRVIRAARVSGALAIGGSYDT